jgi:hypothetical protein
MLLFEFREERPMAQMTKNALDDEPTREPKVSDDQTSCEEAFWDASESIEQDPEEIDFEGDPLENPDERPSESSNWNYSFFSQFVPREPLAPDTERMTAELRELMMKIEAGPGEIDPEQEALKDWLQSVHEKVYPTESFVARSFARHLPV